MSRGKTDEDGRNHPRQALGEEVDDVVPGPLRVPRVVADAGEQGLVGRGAGVMEGVQGAAVGHQAPVDAGGLHLGGERLSLLLRLNGVFRPDPGPDRAADARCVAWSSRHQRVDGADRAQVGAVASELQHDPPSGAVADAGDLIRIGPGLGAQHVERRVADGPHPVVVGEQRHAARQHLLGVGQLSPAVDVEGQRHVSEPGERLGPAAIDVVEPDSLRSDQDRGPPVDTGGKGEVPDHRQAVGRVLNGARRDRRHEPDRSDRRTRPGRCSSSAEHRL